MTESTKSQLQTLINENLKLCEDELAILSEKNNTIIKRCLEYYKLYNIRKIEVDKIQLNAKENKEISNDFKLMLDEYQQNIKTLQSEIHTLNKQMQNIKIVNIQNKEINENFKNSFTNKNIKNDFIKNVLKIHISDKSSINHAIGFYQNSEKLNEPFNFYVKKEETDCLWKHFSHKNKTIENLRKILNNKNKVTESFDVISINETKLC